jgi:hypothetical protein
LSNNAHNEYYVTIDYVKYLWYYPCKYKGVAMDNIRLRKSKITTEEIKTLYIVGLRTMEEIGAMAGISRQAVRLILDRIGVEYRGGKLIKQCLYCHGDFQVCRNVTKKGQGNYCSNRCSNAARSLGGDMSVSSRMGRAAWLMAHPAETFKPGQVIHHIDGDRNNNDVGNLRVFNSQTEHMQYHHSLRNLLPR